LRQLSRVGPVLIDTQADYLDGDPAEPGPIADGHLALDAEGVHFSHDGHELHADLEDLRGITVTGSGGPRHRVRSRRRPGGTTRLALSRDNQPMVWEFALDRTEGVRLREQLNTALTGAGLPPLPHIEELWDFEPAVEPVFAELPPVPIRDRDEIDDGDDAWFRQKRFIFALVALMLLLEIGVPLLILFVL